MNEHNFTDEEIVKALECCAGTDGANCKSCPLHDAACVGKCIPAMSKAAAELISRQRTEIERLTAFKGYFNSLYGTGLEIAKWHENGSLEAFDNFYDAAMEEYENKATEEKP